MSSIQIQSVSYSHYKLPSFCVSRSFHVVCIKKRCIAFSLLDTKISFSLGVTKWVCFSRVTTHVSYVSEDAKHLEIVTGNTSVVIFITPYLLQCKME